MVIGTIALLNACLLLLCRLIISIMPPTMHNKTAMVRIHPGRPMTLAK